MRPWLTLSRYPVTEVTVKAITAKVVTG